MKKKFIIIGIFLIFIMLNFNSVNSITTNTDKNLNYISGFQLKFLNNRFFILIQTDTTIPQNGYPVLFLLHSAVQHNISWFIGLNQ